ncbi:hypothetical protein [Halopiger aswanensis]|uniref:Uncharacterized protein n=1 Tax=Halopiger aswanensis TaxID=148449 RepID=A0A3R7GJZ1_9EURY|nr:hypothetical protein [Halopiger aswanensis]RKD97105.1 hypothetical protein ATJ93_0086 [Halopiger aswanensis]
MTADRQPRLRRRGFLAALAAGGSVAIAGCGSTDLPWEDDAAPSFTAADAETLLADLTGPTIEWPAPVQPTRGALEDELERIDSLLESVPSSLTADDVPNGVVREEIADDRDEAREIRDRVSAESDDSDPAANRYRRLRETRGARDAARAAATALTAIDADRAQLVGELEDEHEAVRPTIRDRRAATDYRGVDTDSGRLRAALYWHRREDDLGWAEHVLEQWTVDPAASVVDIGDAAGELEFATATARVWDHFDGRYAADIDDAATGPIDLESAFDTALERSIDRADETGFPSQDGEEWYEAVGLDDLEDQRRRLFAWDIGRRVEDAREGMTDARDDGDLATGLARALEFEQTYRAFETVRDRLQDGAIATPETIDEIRTERTAALEAATAAREEFPPDVPSPGAFRLAETLRSLSWVDDNVRRAADNDPDVVVSLGEEVGNYARVRAQLEALPAAVTALRERLFAA